MSCGKEHQKRRVKLLERFANAEPGTIVEAEVCPDCGVKVTSKQLGYADEGWYMIPSALAEIGSFFSSIASWRASKPKCGKIVVVSETVGRMPGGGGGQNANLDSLSILAVDLKLI